MENLYKKYYGDSYNKAMENSQKEKLKMKANFIKKYQNADISKFKFVVSMKRNGDVDSAATYFKNSDTLSTDITSDTFLNDKSMTKYLYSNINPPKVKQLKKIINFQKYGNQMVQYKKFLSQILNMLKDID